MEQNFNLLAQSRANYYTAGSPVQFVRVELLKGDVTGEIAVCLTFKNISEFPITGLVIQFKCKSASGALLCEDQFYYEGMSAGQGELFGSDDAVYISSDPVASVEIILDRAFLQDGSAHSLSGYRRQRLPAPKLLPPQLAKAMQERSGRDNMTVVPQVLEMGWYCACGAFHPNEEATVYCSECGSDRIMVQNLLTSLMQDRPMQQPEEEPAEAATRPVESDQARFAQEYHRQKAGVEGTEDATRQVEMPAKKEPPHREEAPAQPAPAYDAVSEYDDYDDDVYSHPESHGRYAEEPKEIFSDEVAEGIIRFAPPVTAVLCACIVAAGILIHFLG